MSALTDVLREEHRLVRRAAACLDRLVDHAVESDDLCVFSAAELLEFFEDFADGAHQAKEERYLFPALLASGLADHRVRALHEEHSEERTMLTLLRDRLEGAACGDAQSRDQFVLCAARYSTLQREHADAEDQLVLPVAEELLGDDAARRVLDGFARIEAELLPRSSAHYFALVERVAQRLGSAAPAGLIGAR